MFVNKNNENFYVSFDGDFSEIENSDKVSIFVHLGVIIGVFLWFLR